MKYFRDKLQLQPGAIGIRLVIKDSGCAEYSYALDFATCSNPDDVTFVTEDVKIIIDKKRLPIVVGTEINCVSDNLGEHIKFNNPNATNDCGCGESFSTRK